jgi:hypothetical protein
VQQQNTTSSKQSDVVNSNKAETKSKFDDCETKITIDSLVSSSSSHNQTSNFSRIEKLDKFIKILDEQDKLKVFQNYSIRHKISGLFFVACNA